MCVDNRNAIARASRELFHANTIDEWKQLSEETKRMLPNRCNTKLRIILERESRQRVRLIYNELKIEKEV